MSSVSFRKLEKNYGALRIVKGIDLEIADREFVVLVGPSGCGKSTTLRMLAGLEGISSGEIPDRKPRQLSGGQRQRVAMGRAIVRRPQVFLFDEPLSNLDAKLRGQVRTEIKRLHQAIGTTIIYVTHDQVEAMTLADRIVILKGGEIEQVGTPDEVYNSPASVFVGGFIGSPAMNFAKGTIRSGQVMFDGGAVIPLQSRSAGRADGLEGREVVVGIRPEHFVPAGEGHALS